MKDVQIFGREPVVIANAIEGIMACLIAFHALAWANIDSTASMLIVMAVVNGLMGVYVAYFTDETELAALTALIKALIAAAALYGFNLTDEQTAAILSALAVVMALWQRTQVVAIKSRARVTTTRSKATTPRTHTVAHDTTPSDKK